MATTVKEGGHVKERRSSSPSVVPGNNTNVPRGRRTPKSSSIEGSPDRDIPAASLPGKSVPNYLKPTLSSCRDGAKPGRKHPPPSETTASKRPITSRRNTDKPPSAQPLKTPTPTLSKEKTLKSSYSMPKTAANPRPVSDKTTASKTPKPGQTRRSLTRARSFPKRAKNVKSEESGGSASSCGAISDPDTTEKSTAKLEKDETDHPAADNSPDVEKIEDKERNIPSELHHVHDEIPVDGLMVSDKLHESSDSTPQLEEHEPTPTSAEESELSKDDETGTSDEEKDGTKENEEEQHSEVGQAGEVVPQEPSGELNEEEDSTEKKTTQLDKREPGDSIDESAIRELKFRRGREISDSEGAGVEDQIKENVVLKRKGVQGKKDSPAYNDVIEETASKLVEKRKSKVKALVGAFETVISLQEPEGPSQPEPAPASAGEPAEAVPPDVHNTTTESTDEAD